MKYLLPVSCSCGESFAEDVVGTEVPETVHCPRCGSPIDLIAPLGNVVAMAILSRARTEFENGDWTLTIVLSAMGVECELVFLFMKWSRLDPISCRKSWDPAAPCWTLIATVTWTCCL